MKLVQSKANIEQLELELTIENGIGGNNTVTVSLRNTGSGPVKLIYQTRVPRMFENEQDLATPERALAILLAENLTWHWTPDYDWSQRPDQPRSSMWSLPKEAFKTQNYQVSLKSGERLKIQELKSQNIQLPLRQGSYSCYVTLPIATHDGVNAELFSRVNQYHCMGNSYKAGPSLVKVTDWDQKTKELMINAGADKNIDKGDRYRAKHEITGNEIEIEISSVLRHKSRAKIINKREAWQSQFWQKVQQAKPMYWDFFYVPKTQEIKDIENYKKLNQGVTISFYETDSGS